MDTQGFSFKAMLDELHADDHWHASKVQDAMAEIKDATTRVIEYVIAELKVELFERDGRME